MGAWLPKFWDNPRSSLSWKLPHHYSSVSWVGMLLVVYTFHVGSLAQRPAKPIRRTWRRHGRSPVSYDLHWPTCGATGWGTTTIQKLTTSVASLVSHSEKAQLLLFRRPRKLLYFKVLEVFRVCDLVSWRSSKGRGGNKTNMSLKFFATRSNWHCRRARLKFMCWKYDPNKFTCWKFGPKPTFLTPLPEIQRTNHLSDSFMLTWQGHQDHQDAPFFRSLYSHDMIGKSWSCGSGVEVGKEISKAVIKDFEHLVECLDFPSQSHVLSGKLWPSRHLLQTMHSLPAWALQECRTLRFLPCCSCSLAKICCM